MVVYLGGYLVDEMAVKMVLHWVDLWEQEKAVKLVDCLVVH